MPANLLGRLKYMRVREKFSKLYLIERKEYNLLPKNATNNIWNAISPSYLRNELVSLLNVKENIWISITIIYL